MVIYKDYTTDELLQDLPCFILGCGMIYPLKVKEYQSFLSKYGSLFMFDEESLNMILPKEMNKENMTYMSKVILYNSLSLQTQSLEYGVEMGGEAFIKNCLNDLEKAFSIVTKKQIKYNNENNSFTDDSNSININVDNFSDVRKVIAMQNLIKEPTMYEDAEYTQLIMEARRRKNKQNGGNINISEMVTYVKNYGKVTYEEIFNENVLQLFADYRSMIQMEYYRTIMNFKLVSSEVGNTNLAEGFIDDLYKKDTDEDLLTTTSEIFG